MNEDRKVGTGFKLSGYSPCPNCGSDMRINFVECDECGHVRDSADCDCEYCKTQRKQDDRETE